MFPSAGAATSPRRQSVTYPGYQAQYADYPPAHGGYGGHGPGEAAQSAAQWPGYHGLYTRYDADWNSVHHAATAAAALSAASHHFQPPSPAASAPHGSAEAGGDAGPGAGLYGGGVYVKPGSLCAPASGDFKPPILGDVRGLDDHGGEADPLRSQSGAVAGAGGRAHHSPDSGLAASDGVSGSDSPNHVLHQQQPPSPGLHHDLALPARPQPARSPYEWMKRPSISGRPCKEGSDGRTRTKDKYRVVYSDHQRLELEKEFHYSRYITIRRKAELAQALSLSERQVKIWFQNRRAKERKQVKKRDELMTKDKIDVGGISVHPSHMAAMSGFALGPMGHMMHHPQHLPHL